MEVRCQGCVKSRKGTMTTFPLMIFFFFLIQKIFFRKKHMENGIVLVGLTVAVTKL